MEKFCLEAKHQPRRGLIWELQLFPDQPIHQLRKADSRVLGYVSSPESIQWLREIADPFLRRALDPEPIEANKFGPKSPPRWLHPEDGMRLALAFSAARWLVNPAQRRRFREGLSELPSEVVLYWFTLCFYGYRQAAGKAALRTLLTHEEPENEEQEDTVSRPARKGKAVQPVAALEEDLFSLAEVQPPAPVIREEPVRYERKAPAKTKEEKPTTKALGKSKKVSK